MISLQVVFSREFKWYIKFFITFTNVSIIIFLLLLSLFLWQHFHPIIIFILHLMYFLVHYIDPIIIFILHLMNFILQNFHSKIIFIIPLHFLLII